MKQTLSFMLLSLYLIANICNGSDKPDNINKSQKLQQPFICKTVEAGLGNPIVDNVDKIGTPVYIENNKGGVLVEIGETLGITTNNIAEYSAITAGLSWVIQNKNKMPYLSKINF